MSIIFPLINGHVNNYFKDFYTGKAFISTSNIFYNKIIGLGLTLRSFRTLACRRVRLVSKFNDDGF